MATLFKDRVSIVYFVNKKVCKKRMCKFEIKGGCIDVNIRAWSFYLFVKVPSLNKTVISKFCCRLSH